MVDFFLCLKQRKIQIKVRKAGKMNNSSNVMSPKNHYMPELLLKIVADAKMWTCLQQLLQYRVIEDSKFLVGFQVVTYC
jgi:hypothetical protein